MLETNGKIKYPLNFICSLQYLKYHWRLNAVKLMMNSLEELHALILEVLVMLYTHANLMMKFQQHVSTEYISSNYVIFNLKCFHHERYSNSIFYQST